MKIPFLVLLLLSVLSVSAQRDPYDMTFYTGKVQVITQPDSTLELRDSGAIKVTTGKKLAVGKPDTTEAALMVMIEKHGGKVVVSDVRQKTSVSDTYSLEYLGRSQDPCPLHIYRIAGAPVGSILELDVCSLSITLRSGRRTIRYYD